MHSRPMTTAATTEFEEVLRQCGVTGSVLLAAEREALDRDGYLLLRNVVERAWLARMRDAFEAAAQGIDRRSGTRHVRGLDDSAFDGIYTQPRLLAAVYHILRTPFTTAQAHGRDPLPGFGQQGLHADWMPLAPGEPFRIATAIWLLDDFTETNGATRLVPGTHRRPSPPKRAAAPHARHPEERVIVAPAGSVLVFNGHLWHSGTRNASERSRRVLQCVFASRDTGRPGDEAPQIAERLPPAVRYLMGARQ